MGNLDRWAETVGSSACRFLSGNGHDTVYRGLCYQGSEAAGWRLVIFISVLAVITYGMWRLLGKR